jgi:hypothetical protein
MDPVLQIFLVLAIFAHAVGHILFLVPTLGIAGWGQSGRSWMLTDRIGSTLTHGLGAVIWSLVILAYLAGIYSYLTYGDGWTQLLTGASLLSAIGLILFWDKSAPVRSAMAVNLIVILALQVLHWPGSETIARIF